jgi:hypothetical protein
MIHLIEYPTSMHSFFNSLGEEERQKLEQNGY